MNKKYTYILPGWIGYFNWDYALNEWYFLNGDYKLNWLLLIDLGVDKRTDWIKII